jgi:hypothetical protein
MRTILFGCIGLGLMGTLAAQSEAAGQVPGDQCLPGALVAIQQNSITLKFNEKVTTMPIAPDAEIWRRGADVESIHQLVLGDDIYLRCTRAVGNGAVMASVVAAVEKGSSVYLEPHHLKEYSVCGGHLVAIEKDTLSVKNDDGICVMRIDADTKIWRGEILHDTSGLKIGDVVDARITIGYPNGELTAEEVWVNITITEGTIVAVRSDRIVVNQYPGADKHSAYPRGHVTVLFDARTSFDLDEGKLEKGVTVRAVGLDLGRDMFRAATIVVEK